ncbi:MAG TPA: flavodoxin [Firmicutes bacterium]|nr:flavodoxin [Bacillota bacterium]
MRIAIVYYSEHHGNTKKLLDAVKELGDVTLIDAGCCKGADLSTYDIIGFASGTYGGRFSPAVIEFAKDNLPSNKRVFLISTYGLWAARTRDLEQIFAARSCRLLGMYSCRGFCTFGPLKLIGGIAKGHPNERDVKGAVEFFKNIIAQ